ncbi:MAPEG family protein [Pseudoalteromonas xiamenensis]
MVVYIYAALLGFLYVFLSFRVIFRRKKLRVALGDNNNIDIQRAIRAHGNFAEYVPFTLLLIYLVETAYQSLLLAHGLGLALFIGRSLHALSISRQPEPLILRQIGMALTFSVILTSSGLLLANAL